MTSVSHDNYSTAETYSARSAPWSQEAEQAVLGAMLLDQDAALRAAELVDDSMFYREAHRRLFRAMLALTEQRVVIDHITLRDELLRRGSSRPPAVWSIWPSWSTRFPPRLTSSSTPRSSKTRRFSGG